MSSSLLKNIDMKEVELPATDFIFDIETRVLQTFCFQVIKKIEGVHSIEAGIFENLLGYEHLKGIHVQQDSKMNALIIRLEVSVEYGFSLPLKAEELQNQIIREISEFTGLHVSSVHVVFKNLLLKEDVKQKELELTLL